VAAVARPTKLTDEQDRVVAIVRAGNTVALAAVAVGVDERTLLRRLARGERGGASNARHRAFRRAVERARGEAEVVLVALMRRQASSSWRAAAWLLERQYPERWALPADRPAEGGDGVDALDELAERRRGRGP
jgi:hypothetical protein